MKHTAWILVVLALSLAGCNRPPPEETVFDDQLETMDRARAVEDELADRATRLEQQMDEASAGEDAPQ